MTFLKKYVPKETLESSVRKASLTEVITTTDAPCIEHISASEPLPLPQVSCSRSDTRIAVIASEALALGWTESQLWRSPVRAYPKALADVIKPRQRITAVTHRFIELTEATVTGRTEVQRYYNDNADQPWKQRVPGAIQENPSP